MRLAVLSLVFVMAVCAATGQTVSAPLAAPLAAPSTADSQPITAADPTTARRVQAADLIYAGAFRIPEGDRVGCDYGTGAHCFTYGGLFGLGPNGGSLYLRGHAWAGGVGEVSVPATLTLAETATVLQDIHDPSDGVEVDPGEVNGQGPFAGLVHNDRLIVSGSTYYDADGSQTDTHGVSGLDLSRAGDFDGWYRFDPALVANPRSIGGYMTSIPSEWQALLGGPAFTGNCCLSIISHSSAGPAATVFDPADVGVTDPLTGTTVLFYPLAHPLEPESTQNDYFNLATQIGGVAFPAATRSVLFIGRQGTGPYCYGDGAPCGDVCDGSKGTHAYPYRHQIWAYDANDLAAVRSGLKQTWEIRPYAVWPLNEMDSSGCASISGAVYDPVANRLFIAERYGDQPIVHVYTIAHAGHALDRRLLLPALAR
ncbi:MAG: hypothetical protein JNL73_10560 [Anaerolineales bacterium]|nr:hypothetical protein [Anaerolineales bacterium]